MHVHSHCNAAHALTLHCLLPEHIADAEAGSFSYVLCILKKKLLFRDHLGAESPDSAFPH